MSDGSITVIDLKAEAEGASTYTLESSGHYPNGMPLLPAWNEVAGH